MSAKEHFILELTFAFETMTHCKHEKGVIAAAIHQALKESETYIGYSFANDLQGQIIKSYLLLICNSEKAREYIAADLRQGLAEELWQNERIKELEKQIGLLLSEIEEVEEAWPAFDIRIIKAAQKMLEKQDAS